LFFRPNSTPKASSRLRIVCVRARVRVCVCVCISKPKTGMDIAAGIPEFGKFSIFVVYLSIP